MLQKEILIKFQEQLREMVPEVIEDLSDDRDLMTIAENMVDGLMEVINDEYYKRNPGAPMLLWEIY